MKYLITIPMIIAATTTPTMVGSFSGSLATPSIASCVALASALDAVMSPFTSPIT